MRAGFAQLELELHLQPRERRAQLMGGIRQEPALRLARLANSLEQPVERDDRGEHLGRRVRFVDGSQIVRRALLQFVAQLSQRRKAMAHAEPYEPDGDDDDEQRRHQSGQNDFPDQAIALVGRFGDVHLESRVGEEGANPYLRAADGAL